MTAAAACAWCGGDPLGPGICDACAGAFRAELVYRAAGSLPGRTHREGNAVTEPTDDGFIVQVLEVEALPGTVAVLRAVLLSGEPCRVACDPREAAGIAARLEAEGQPCYALAEPWQLV